MYSMPQVYGDKPFNRVYLPNCMYPMKPYYEEESGAHMANEKMDHVVIDSSLLDVPLTFPADINLNDPNTKYALEDILSRQMMLLCRLNELERQLTIGTTKLTKTSDKSDNVSPLSKIPVNRFQFQVATNSILDIVIHFNVDYLPFSIFSILNVLQKDGVKVLTNFHVHSSVNTDDRCIQRKLDTLHQKLSSINFSFTNSEEFSNRSQFSLSMTFIAKCTLDRSTNCYSIFGFNQKPILGEIEIAKKLIELVTPPTNIDNEKIIWSLLLNDGELKSDKECFEKLGQHCMELSETTFLFQQTMPSLLDVVLWSCIHSGIGANCLQSLFNCNWQSAVQFYVTRQ